MIKAKVLFVVIFSILFHCCENSSKRIDSKVIETQSQSFIRDIPSYRNGKYLYSYFLTKEYTQKAGLKILENGFDSVCIRLWYIYAYGPSWQVVEIKRIQEKWVAEFILLTEIVNKNDTLSNISKTSVLKMPKSGWNIFLKNLFSKNIITLPAKAFVTGYELNTDTDIIAVEIATKQYYRIYDYSSLKFNLNIKEARAMADIMIMIEKEFGVERLNKDF